MKPFLILLIAALILWPSTPALDRVQVYRDYQYYWPFSVTEQYYRLNEAMPTRYAWPKTP